MKNKIKQFIKDIFIYFIIITSFRIYSYNKEWDEKLNYLLNNYELEYKDRYEIKINGVDIWVENFPYAYGKPGIRYNLDVMPSKKTIFKLYKKHQLILKTIEKERIKNILSNIDIK